MKIFRCQSEGNFKNSRHNWHDKIINNQRHNKGIIKGIIANERIFLSGREEGMGGFGYFDFDIHGLGNAFFYIYLQGESKL